MHWRARLGVIMARPIWTGIISFGLLNVPVGLYSAERRVDLHFRMLDSRDNKPIRYERVNAETGEEVPWKNIVKAFEYEKGNYVVLQDEDLDAVAPEGKETIDIESFVDRTAINPMYYEKPYYLVPGKKAEKGYVLLRETLRKTDRVGLGHVIIRARRYLSIVMVVDDALVLNLLRFGQELVPSSSFNFPSDDLKAYRITPRELEMAEQLVESMAAPWEPEGYRDDYRERLSDIVEQRLASKENVVYRDERAEEVPENAATNVVDFTALLKQSLSGKTRKPAAAPPPKKAARSSRKSPPRKPAPRRSQK
jgi:DNA end-binding protein Ku